MGPNESFVCTVLRIPKVRALVILVMENMCLLWHCRVVAISSRLMFYVMSGWLFGTDHVMDCEVIVLVFIW